MPPPLLTFIDSCLLIEAATGATALAEKALEILDDPNRTFASSSFVKLEVMPGPSFHGIDGELRSYESFFKRVSAWATCDEELVRQALNIATADGVLGAMDALHVAAAAQLGCAELWTAEKAGKPLLRAKAIAVKTIR